MGRNFSRDDLVVLIILALVLAVFILSECPHRPSPFACKSACMSNQHNIGLGYLLYRNDYDGAWPHGVTSGECLGKLYPKYVLSLGIFSCMANPTTPVSVDGEIRKAGYLQDVAIPKDADPLRVILGDRRDNHEGGSVLLFADGHMEFCYQVNGLVPNPYLPEDTDVYSDQPDVDGTIDCNL